MSRHGLICRLRPATIRCTAICAVRKAGCSPGLFLLPERGGRGRNAIRATDRQTGQTEELSALQSRENERNRAVPPLPLQPAGAHAPAAARHRTAGGVDRRQRLARRRELLRRPLQVNPGVRRGTLAIISIHAARLGNMSPRIALVEFFPSWLSISGMRRSSGWRTSLRI